MAKPRVAFFDFTCCEGCQLMVSNLEERLVELVEVVDIVEFREIMSERADEYDIAFIEGSISRPKDVPRIEDIRKRSKLVVVLGSCAAIGGVNCLKNRHDFDEARRKVYGEMWASPHLETFEAKPVDAVIQVDATVHGCPIDRDEFLEVVTSLVIGKTPRIPTYPVCVECKMRGNVCLYHKGKWCLGPLIRAGCGAICPTFGHACDGCRGPVEDMNLQAFHDMMADYDMDANEVLRHVEMYNGWTMKDALAGVGK